ncbi:hypothetical protein CLAIMM_07371 [Cladophialophora immunda]|nr:hypothetical protein CLAIMM_07371 [Cladophialophora immunda]
MASDHIFWMMVWDRLGVYDWWAASAKKRAKYSSATVKHEDFPLKAKDFSGGSLFASEPWIEGQRFVVPKVTTGAINHHTIDKNPVLLKTCIPLPIEEGVLRPTCPVIQRQPRVEMPGGIGMNEVSYLPKSFVGRNVGFPPGGSLSLGIIAVLLALAVGLCFSHLASRRKDLVHEGQMGSLANKVENQKTINFILNDQVRTLHKSKRGMETELQDIRGKVDEVRESVKAMDELTKNQQAMLEEKDSLIKRLEATLAEQEARIKEQEATMAEQEAAIKRHQDTQARLGEMEELLRQKEKAITEKVSAIARLTEEKQAAAEEASALGGTRDRLTQQLEEATKELRSATYFDKDLSRRREEQLAKQNKKLHAKDLHIKALKAQIEGLGQVPAPAPPQGDATAAPAPTSGQPEPPAPGPSAPAAPHQSVMESRWADAAPLPPSQPAAFRGGWQGRGRGRGRGGRRP